MCVKPFSLGIFLAWVQTFESTPTRNWRIEDELKGVKFLMNYDLKMETECIKLTIYWAGIVEDRHCSIFCHYVEILTA